MNICEYEGRQESSWRKDWKDGGGREITPEFKSLGSMEEEGP